MTMISEIERFLVADIAGDLGIHNLGPDDDLLEQRIIDSLGILKLVSFLEETYGIQIGDDEIVPENFQSLTSLVNLVEQKRHI